jgi:hypothetical protein
MPVTLGIIKGGPDASANNWGTSSDLPPEIPTTDRPKEVEEVDTSEVHGRHKKRIGQCRLEILAVGTTVSSHKQTPSEPSPLSARVSLSSIHGVAGL